MNARFHPRRFATVLLGAAIFLGRCADATAQTPPAAAADSPWPSPLGRFFLVSAEGLYVVEPDGRASWSHHPSGSARQFHGSEDDLVYDGWTLPNGHFLFSTHRYVREIDAAKKTVWEYRVAAPFEVKSGVPLPNGHVAALDSHEQAILELEPGTARILHRTPVPAKGNDHSRYMLVRDTPEGHFIVALREEQKFVEVDRDGNVLRSRSVPRMPVMARRLSDGTTLGTGYFGMIRLDADWKELWSLKAEDVAGVFPLQLPWGVTELPDHRLLVANSDWHLRAKDGNRVQFFAMDPAKRVSWTLPSAAYAAWKPNAGDPDGAIVEYHSVSMQPLPRR